MRVRLILVSLVALAILVAIPVLWQSRGKGDVAAPGSPEAPSAAQASPSASTAPADLPRGLGWRVGEVIQYTVAVRRTVRTRRSGAPGSPEAVEQVQPLGFQGRWKLGVVAEEGSSAIVRASLNLEGLQMDQAEPPVTPEQRQAFESSLQAPVFLQLARSGRVEALRVPPALQGHPGALAAIKLLVGAMQVSYAPEPQPSWEVIEQDGLGQYLASYEARTSSTLVKRKVRYLSVATPTGRVSPGPELEVTVDGRRELVVASEGWVRRLGLREQVLLRPLGKAPQRQEGGRETRIELLATSTLLSHEPTGAAVGKEDWREYPEVPLAHHAPEQP
jgi:hypothetical protein